MHKDRFYLIGAVAFFAIMILVLIKPGASSPKAFTVSPNKEIGAWIWDPVDQMSTSTMAQLVDAAAANHFNALYLSIDDYLSFETMAPGVERQAALQNLSTSIYNFISLAHQKNISVDAEAGETDWGEPQNYKYAEDIFNFVSSFNVAHDGKFRGVQYDVESYSLPQYGSDPVTVLTQYVGLVSDLVARDNALASPAPIPLTMIVPYFYTAENGSTSPITVNGVSDYAYGQIVRALNALPRGDGRVMVLAYRNTATGSDGSVALARPEVQVAGGTNVSVVIAQETGNVQPGSITFYGMPKTSLFSSIQQIDSAFSSETAYGGVAVDYLNSFLAMGG